MECDLAVDAPVDDVYRLTSQPLSPIFSNPPKHSTDQNAEKQTSHQALTKQSELFKWPLLIHLLLLAVTGDITNMCWYTIAQITWRDCTRILHTMTMVIPCEQSEDSEASCEAKEKDTRVSSPVRADDEQCAVCRAAKSKDMVEEGHMVAEGHRADHNGLRAPMRWSINRHRV